MQTDAGLEDDLSDYAEYERALDAAVAEYVQTTRRFRDLCRGLQKSPEPILGPLDRSLPDLPFPFPHRSQA